MFLTWDRDLGLPDGGYGDNDMTDEQKIIRAEIGSLERVKCRWNGS